VVSGTDDVPLLHQWAQHHGFMIEQLQESASPTFQLAAERSTPQLVRELVQAGINIEEVRVARQSLEEAFMELVA